MPRDEIVRRVQAMGSKFKVRNGLLLYKQKGGECLNVTDPPSTACTYCRKQGQGGKRHLFMARPHLSDGAMASSGGTCGCWWAQKAKWKRHKQELSDRNREYGRGMRWYSGGVGSSGATPMKISTPWCPHPGNRLLGTQWRPTYGRSPGYSERRNIASRKQWSWPTYSRCTGDGRQTPQFEGPLAQSARWRIWKGSSPLSARNCGAWPSTHCQGKTMTGRRLGVRRRCSLYPRVARIELIGPSMSSRYSPLWESSVSGRRHHSGDEDLATMPCVSGAFRIAGGFLQ